MFKYHQAFSSYIGVKSEPNKHENALFDRAKYYIAKISNTRGVEMIAIVNSLSMYATHADSDIDLCIITHPGMLWYVRFWITLKLWFYGVWRHGDDIAGNFCLSFFMTTEAMDLSQIAIKDDIYLYYWIYYLKPIFVRDHTYEQFLDANNWVQVNEKQRKENSKYRIITDIGNCGEIMPSRGLGRETVGGRGEKKNNRAKPASFSLPNGFGTFATKSTEKLCLKGNILLKKIVLPKTLRKYEKLGKPEGVIISDTMLKFHDQDRRYEIRDAILSKNFDK